MHVLDQAKMPPLKTAARIMGILNVTPDSFSDGGVHAEPSAAVDFALRMIDEGATIIDVGPESTRPGAEPVSAEEQIRRAIPVITALRARNDHVSISIDTCSAHVARAAIDAGADMVNDTSALRDDRAMVSVVAECGVSVVLMHRRGTPATMQTGGGPVYDDVVSELCAFLRDRFAFAVEHGVSPERIVVDPGIGFGKRTGDNLRILNECGRFAGIRGDGEPGVPVLIGASRKRFIGETVGIEDPALRDPASVVAALIAVQRGATIVRVHDVRATFEALRLAAAIESDVQAQQPQPRAHHVS